MNSRQESGIEVFINQGIVNQAREIAKQMIGSDAVQESFVPEEQTLGGKPTFQVSKERGDLFVLTSFEEGGVKFYLGTQK
ncbi:hypothetical protein KJ673_01090 [Patescibacteria group bacterium]|nr:hypothetical protein [Patescibacteria group bacterium]MBU4453289.1 hypothetical protein [Patescibacteria group bacterium]MCG2687437.1 hypothetical protein [Candidatus Parcubacteria bacterium]